MNNEICRIEIETAAHQLIIDKQYEDGHEDTGEPTSSIFDASPMVAEDDQFSVEQARRKAIRKQNGIDALNEKNDAYRKEQAMAKQMKASK